MFNCQHLFPCGDVRNLSEGSMKLVTLYAFVFWIVCVYLIIKIVKGVRRAMSSRGLDKSFNAASSAPAM